MQGSVDWWGFALTVLVLELTPGPNMAWLVGLSATDGRRAGLSATAGIALGLLLNGMLAAWGLAELVAREPMLQQWLRLFGAIMLGGLALQSWRNAESKLDNRQARKGFVAGLLINTVNPKAFVLFVAIAPTFFHGAPIPLSAMAALAMISAGIATAVHVVLVLGADRAHGWFSDPVRTTSARKAMALTMLGVAVWFVAG